MNDRHEQSRAAFLQKYPYLSDKWNEEKHCFRDSTTRELYEIWEDALDYAAEQQAKQPEPLSRPDRPGWWWNWNPHRQEWRCWTVSKPEHEDEGLWLPATPPPAPSQKEGEG